MATVLLLSIAGVAVFPCWKYSARWSYAPSLCAGVLLFMVSLAVVGGRATGSEALAIRLAVPHEKPAVEVSMIEKSAPGKVLPTLD